MRRIDTIVIHCSATRENKDYSFEQLKVDHKRRGFRTVGYHFYIKKDGTVFKGRELEEIGAHAKGYNRFSVGICYEGGLDENGKPKDTRTEAQKGGILDCINVVITAAQDDFQRGVKNIIGHRDLSEDKNKNGKIESWERMKECPCFDAIPEYQWVLA